MNGKIKVLFLNSAKTLVEALWSDKAFRMAEEFGFEVTIPDLKNDNQPNWSAMIGDYDAVISSWGSPRLEGKILEEAKKLKVVGHAAGSVCAVVSEEVYAHGAKVTTANPVMAESVAEWSLMATLLASRQLQNYAKIFGLSPMKWTSRDKLSDIRSMTVGIWGLGDISMRLLRLLAPLKPGRILLCSKHVSPETLRETGAVQASLEELLAEADIIHLLAALTTENLGRLGAKELGMVKDGATLINAGRARLIDEKALIEELSKRRFNAFLDVFHKEPPEANYELMKLDNVILTPHNAGGPGKNLYVPYVLEEFARLFRGEPMQSEITLQRHRTMTVEDLAMGKSQAQ